MDCVSMYLNGLYILLYYSADLVSGPLKTSFKCLLYSGGGTPPHSGYTSIMIVVVIYDYGYFKHVLIL